MWPRRVNVSHVLAVLLSCRSETLNLGAMSMMKGLKKIEDVIRANMLVPLRFRFVVIEAKARDHGRDPAMLVNNHFSQTVGETFCL